MGVLTYNVDHSANPMLGPRKMPNTCQSPAPLPEHPHLSVNIPTQILSRSPRYRSLQQRMTSLPLLISPPLGGGTLTPPRTAACDSTEIPQGPHLLHEQGGQLRVEASPRR